MYLGTQSRLICKDNGLQNNENTSMEHVLSRVLSVLLLFYVTIATQQYDSTVVSVVTPAGEAVVCS